MNSHAYTSGRLCFGSVNIIGAIAIGPVLRRFLPRADDFFEGRFSLTLCDKLARRHFISHPLTDAPRAVPRVPGGPCASLHRSIGIHKKEVNFILRA